MKEIDGLVKIKKYTDDEGKPVCGGCKLDFDTYDCEYSIAGNGPEYFLLPGPSCPVWHGESKSDPLVYLLALMAALEIPNPEWWLAKPTEFIAECGKAITAQAKLAQEK